MIHHLFMERGFRRSLYDKAKTLLIVHTGKLVEINLIGPDALISLRRRILSQAARISRIAKVPPNDQW